MVKISSDDRSRDHANHKHIIAELQIQEPTVNSQRRSTWISQKPTGTGSRVSWRTVSRTCRKESFFRMNVPSGTRCRKPLENSLQMVESPLSNLDSPPQPILRTKEINFRSKSGRTTNKRDEQEDSWSSRGTPPRKMVRASGKMRPKKRSQASLEHDQDALWQCEEDLITGHHLQETSVWPEGDREQIQSAIHRTDQEETSASNSSDAPELEDQLHGTRCGYHNGGREKTSKHKTFQGPRSRWTITADAEIPGTESPQLHCGDVPDESQHGSDTKYLENGMYHPVAETRKTGWHWQELLPRLAPLPASEGARDAPPSYADCTPTDHWPSAWIPEGTVHYVGSLRDRLSHHQRPQLAQTGWQNSSRCLGFPSRFWYGQYQQTTEHHTCLKDPKVHQALALLLPTRTPDVCGV